MSSTRRALEQFDTNLAESMGARKNESRPQLSPVVSEKDIGRRPLRTFERIDINRVEPDPNQPRSEFSEEALEQLAASIGEKGQFHPIRVRWDKPRSKWLIISGERRWRAAKKAGLSTIECFFHEGAVSDKDTLEQQLVENLLREDLKPIEEAKGFASLMELNGWNGKEVAKALNVPEWKVSRSLALLDLPDAAQAQVDAGTLPKRTAYEITKIKDSESQEALTAAASRGELSHKQAAAEVRKRKGKTSQKPKSRGTKQTFFAEGGWKVIVSNRGKGTYEEMELALKQATDEVRHYITHGKQIL